MRPTTVSDLVEQVRSQIDEDNTIGIRTLEDIVTALNRAQDHAAEILAKHYVEPLIKDITVVIGKSACKLWKKVLILGSTKIERQTPTSSITVTNMAG